MRERARELALPDALRAVEEVRVARTARCERVERRVEQAHGLRLLVKAREPAHAPAPRSRRAAASRRARRSARGRALRGPGTPRRRARRNDRPPARCGRGAPSTASSRTPARPARRNVRSGKEAARRREVQLEDAAHPEAACDSLVGDRRVDVAVADDPRAALVRRADHALDELRPCGRVERRLGPRRHVGAVEEELPDPLPDLRAARLARVDDVATVLDEPVAEELRLRRFPPTRRSPRTSRTSSAYDTAGAGGRDRGSRVHRVEPRRRARRARGRGDGRRRPRRPESVST